MLDILKRSANKLFIILFISIFSISILSGCSNNEKQQSNHARKKRSTQKKSPTGNNVWMKNLAFVPKIKVVKVGETVTWTNKDVAMHTVQSGTPEKPIKTISSKTMGKGNTFSYTFTRKGTYQYFCTTHPTIMQATIVVQ